MNASLLTLLAIIILPVVVLMVLRINATLVFLSLCLGSVLTRYISEDTSFVVSLTSSTVPQAGTLSDSSVKLGLLLLPVLLTALIMVKTVRGRAKLLLNALPAAGVGSLGALLAVPLLPAGTAANITGSWLWMDFVKLQDLIVGASALLCLFVLWLQRPKTGGHSEEKHSKKHSR